MAKEKNTFYITTPIFYPNAELHMGGAYTTTLCDILARYNRAQGKEVYFLTGADENTEKVVRAAESAGEETGAYLNSIVAKFKDLFGLLNIEYDQFIRTSDKENHWPGAKLVWRQLEEAGDIYKSSYNGLYCVGHEAFMTEKDLVDGKCPDHNEEPQVIEEENYFFRLSKYTEVLKEKIESDELVILPSERKNEILSLLNDGLEDISFSRPKDKVTLGIPVPNDPEQVMYVWCDALTNYISALGYGRESQLFDKFWPANVHVIGKDILRFHAAIWPAMLLSAGLPLPKTILVHGMITSGGKKMSKTLGNVIDPTNLIDTHGGEAVRYFLARHISTFNDGDITTERFHDAYTADLVNGIGNLTNRILKMSETHLTSGVVLDDVVYPEEYDSAFRENNVQKATEYVWKQIGDLDQKIQDTEPFKLVKEDVEKAKTLIEELVQELNVIAILLVPILPETSEKIIAAIKENKKPEEPLFPRK
ncbi:methionine--tRNA ligase [Candidatus Wolfebacteria bacterium]|nr:MAG: methionine--tRNA ligase [Candidatus Wolfebacteria bacterium]